MYCESFSISNSPQWYEAWPDVALLPNGHLLCVFNECTHHCHREYSRIILIESHDRGRTWCNRRPLTEGTHGLEYYYNCPRISVLPDGRVVIVVDRIPAVGEAKATDTPVAFYFSHDNGVTWDEPLPTPLNGIVPDKLTVLDTGRWLIAAHRRHEGRLTEFLHYSDDQGKTWSPEIVLAHDERYDLCEVSMLPMGQGTIVAFLRENSGQGLDCMKCLSRDNGEHWSPLINFPLPACHRPVSGHLQDGRILITHRFFQGGGCGMGCGTQNFFGALTDDTSALAETRKGAAARIFPIDYDSAFRADTGYSGWVQFEDGEIYVVNYIVDDAIDKGQIRGYSLRLDTLVRPPKARCQCAGCNCPNKCHRFG